MPTPIRKPDGTFAGSIGDGKQAIPNTSIPAPSLTQEPVQLTAEEGLAEKIKLFTKTRTTVQIPDFADPETTMDIVTRIEQLGNQMSEQLEWLRDVEWRAQARPFASMFPNEAAQRIATSKKRQDQLHTACLAAREHLDAARERLDGTRQETERGATKVVDADDVSHTAWRIRVWLEDQDDLQNAWNRGEIAVIEKIQQASAHVLKAKHILDVAYTRDQDENK